MNDELDELDELTQRLRRRLVILGFLFGFWVAAIAVYLIVVQAFR